MAALTGDFNFSQSFAHPPTTNSLGRQETFKTVMLKGESATHQDLRNHDLKLKCSWDHEAKAWPDHRVPSSPPSAEPAPFDSRAPKITNQDVKLAEATWRNAAEHNSNQPYWQSRRKERLITVDAIRAETLRELDLVRELPVATSPGITRHGGTAGDRRSSPSRLPAPDLGGAPAAIGSGKSIPGWDTYTTITGPFVSASVVHAPELPVAQHLLAVTAAATAVADSSRTSGSGDIFNGTGRSSTSQSATAAGLGATGTNADTLSRRAALASRGRGTDFRDIHTAHALVNQALADTKTHEQRTLMRTRGLPVSGFIDVTAPSNVFTGQGQATPASTAAAAAVRLSTVRHAAAARAVSPQRRHDAYGNVTRAEWSHHPDAALRRHVKPDWVTHTAGAESEREMLAPAASVPVEPWNATKYQRGISRTWQLDADGKATMNASLADTTGFGRSSSGGGGGSASTRRMLKLRVWSGEAQPQHELGIKDDVHASTVLDDPQWQRQFYRRHERGDRDPAMATSSSSGAIGGAITVGGGSGVLTMGESMLFSPMQHTSASLAGAGGASSPSSSPSSSAAARLGAHAAAGAPSLSDDLHSLLLEHAAIPPSGLSQASQVPGEPGSVIGRNGITTLRAAGMQPLELDVRAASRERGPSRQRVGVNEDSDRYPSGNGVNADAARALIDTAVSGSHPFLAQSRRIAHEREVQGRKAHIARADVIAHRDAVRANSSGRGLEESSVFASTVMASESIRSGVRSKNVGGGVHSHTTVTGGGGGGGGGGGHHSGGLGFDGDGGDDELTQGTILIHRNGSSGSSSISGGRRDGGGGAGATVNSINSDTVTALASVQRPGTSVLPGSQVPPSRLRKSRGQLSGTTLDPVADRGDHTDIGSSHAGVSSGRKLRTSHGAGTGTARPQHAGWDAFMSKSVTGPRSEYHLGALHVGVDYAFPVKLRNQTVFTRRFRVAAAGLSSAPSCPRGVLRVRHKAIPIAPGLSFTVVIIVKALEPGLLRGSVHLVSDDGHAFDVSIDAHVLESQQFSRARDDARATGRVTTLAEYKQRIETIAAQWDSDWDRAKSNANSPIRVAPEHPVPSLDLSHGRTSGQLQQQRPSSSSSAALAASALAAVTANSGPDYLPSGVNGTGRPDFGGNDHTANSSVDADGAAAVMTGRRAATSSSPRPAPGGVSSTRSETHAIHYSHAEGTAADGSRNPYPDDYHAAIIAAAAATEAEQHPSTGGAGGGSSNQGGSRQPAFVGAGSDSPTSTLLRLAEASGTTPSEILSQAIQKQQRDQRRQQQQQRAGGDGSALAGVAEGDDEGGKEGDDDEAQEQHQLTDAAEAVAAAMAASNSDNAANDATGGADDHYGAATLVHVRDQWPYPLVTPDVAAVTIGLQGQGEAMRGKVSVGGGGSSGAAFTTTLARLSGTVGGGLAADGDDHLLSEHHQHHHHHHQSTVGNSASRTGFSTSLAMSLSSAAMAGTMASSSAAAAVAATAAALGGDKIRLGPDSSKHSLSATRDLASRPGVGSLQAGSMVLPPSVNDFMVPHGGTHPLAVPIV